MRETRAVMILVAAPSFCGAAPKPVAGLYVADYAIVARLTDSTTGTLAVIAAGVGRGGTIAAGELLTDPT